MNFLKHSVWPVVAGFIVASVVMMVFEYVNSFLFPLPQNLDWSNAEAVRTFTSSLPWTVYILVLLGWMAGAFAGGWVSTYVSGNTRYRNALALGLVLTFAGVLNNLMIGHHMMFTFISLPQFLIFTYLGHRYCIRLRAPRHSQTVA